MERFPLGAKKEKRSKKERKTAWGLCPISVYLRIAFEGGFSYASGP
jgi:hypothetical protein